jgi:N-acetylneuraminic acid mutarotase
VAAAVLDGRLYVAGGFGELRGVILDELVAYDPTANAWTTLAPLPEPRHHAALTALEGRLFLTGGGVEGFAPRANTWVYDPAVNAWTALAPMPEPRRAHAAVAIGGRLFVVGGVVPGRTLQAPTWAYDPSSGEWRDDRAAIPTYREHLAAVATEDALIAIGGRGTRSVDSVERYDPATDRWTPLPALPTARGGLTAAVLGGEIHVVGGENIDPPKVYREHEVFDVGAGTWSIGTPLDRGRHGLGSGVIEGRLYVAAGGPNPDLSTSDRLDVFAP